MAFRSLPPLAFSSGWGRHFLDSVLAEFCEASSSAPATSPTQKETLHGRAQSQHSRSWSREHWCSRPAILAVLGEALFVQGILSSSAWVVLQGASQGHSSMSCTQGLCRSPVCQLDSKGEKTVRDLLRPGAPDTLHVVTNKLSREWKVCEYCPFEPQQCHGLETLPASVHSLTVFLDFETQSLAFPRFFTFLKSASMK